MKKQTKRKCIAFLLAACMVCGALVPVGGLAANSTGKGTTVVSPSGEILNVTNQFNNLDANLNDILAEKYDSAFVRSVAERTVIVELSGASLTERYLENQTKYERVKDYATSSAGVRQNKLLRSEQKSFLNKLDAKNIGYEVTAQYTSVLNGVAVKVSSRDISTISKLDGVKNVILSENYDRPQADAVFNKVNVYETGIYDSSNLSYSGSGMVAAVLDTGLDYTHAAFQTIPDQQKLAKSDIVDVLDDLTASELVSKLSVEDVYLSGKVPYAFDYMDKDADVYPVVSSHGTHVAGIIAGSDPDASAKDQKTGEWYDFNFRGVAPDAQLAIFKVFSDRGEEGAATDGILAAVNDATLLGVDVINMSLGSGGGFTRESDEEATNAIYDRVRDAGINLVVAAGNDHSQAFTGAYGSTNLTSNPDSGVVGSPSTYGGAISVASISGQLSPYLLANGKTAIYFSNARNSSSKEYDFVAELLPGGVSQKEYKYVVISGYGERHNYTEEIRQKFASGDYIAVVKRGGNVSFEDKQKVAASYGAKGCIIYNNVSGSINASLGTGKKIPTCTVSMDVANTFVGETEGTILVSSTQKAGPFMSDFSSWGATSDLRLLPDIAAHGGDITSAVLGGYGVYSGTSMASPNLAGAVTLLRQHVLDKYQTTGEANATTVNRLLMSTATIAYNEQGNPYSPRKQGAGLANILAAINTDAYLMVNNTNKSKLELGDDKNRSGIYTLRFSIANTSAKAKSYNFGTLTMTETVSSDGITVAERAHMLNGGKVRCSVTGAGSSAGGVVTVDPNGTAEVSVTVVLSAAEKEYLNKNFKNGMFVEGYVTLEDRDSANAVNLNLPWMAFYGNWLDAPMFDASEFDVSADKYDESIEEEDKTLAAVYASLPVGKYYKGVDSYLPMGKYLFKTENDVDSGVQSMIDKIAVSASPNALYEMTYLYTGMLRAAKYMQIDITDNSTGEVLLSWREENVRKSRSNGAASLPSAIELNIDPAKLELQNNVQYKIRMTGALDCEDGDQATNNVFEFAFYVDFEAPTVDSYKVRTVYDSTGKKQVLLDLNVFDNNYTQSVQLFTAASTSSAEMLSRYPIPVNGGRNTVSQVTLDITDYIQNFKDSYYKDRIGVYLYDYAMNGAAYILPMTYDELEGITLFDPNNADEEYPDGAPLTNVSLKVGEVQKFDIRTEPKDLDYQAVSYTFTKSGVVEIRDKAIYAKGAGMTSVKVSALNPKDGTKVEYNFTVTVDAQDGAMPSHRVEKILINNYKIGSKLMQVPASGPLYLNCGVTVNMLAEFQPWYADPIDYEWSSSNPKILTVDAKTGKMTTLQPGTARVQVSWKDNGVTLKNSVSVQVGDKFVTYSSYLYEYHGVDERVVIPADKGILYVNHYSKMTAGPFYQDQNAKVVIVPEGVTAVGTYAFYGSKVETVYLPSSLQSIGYGAFAYCYNLKNIYWLNEDVVYNSDLEDYPDFDQWTLGHQYVKECTAQNLYLGQTAFYNCKALEEIDLSRVTTIFDEAFRGCVGLKSVDISTVRSVGTKVFDTCSSLAEVITGEGTAYGTSMFANCTALRSFAFYGGEIPNMLFYRCKNLASIDIYNSVDRIGNFAFQFCSSLQDVNFHSGVRVREIGGYAFGDCTALNTFTLPNDLNVVGSYAFQNCTNLETVAVERRTNLTSIGEVPFRNCNKLRAFRLVTKSNYYSVREQSVGGVTYGVLCSADGKTVVFMPNAYQPETYEFPAGVTAIGNSAFADSTIEIDTLVIPEGVVSIGSRAFTGNLFRTVVLPSTLEKIDTCAFYSCPNLETVIFKSNKLKSIGNLAFYGCSALTNLNLPESLETIEVSTFRYCTSLRTVTIPRNVKVVGDFAFEGDTALMAVTFADGSRLETIGKQAFAGCAALTAIELPDRLQTLGDYAFTQSGLTSVTIPGSVRTMGGYVFSNCFSLESVVAEEGVEYIGAYAFGTFASNSVYFNPTLKSVTLPDSLMLVGAYAFAGCSGLESIDLKNVFYLDAYAFAGCSGLKKVNLGDCYFIGVYAFSGAPLESIDLSGVTLIGAYAFNNCKTLTDVDLSHVEQIGAAAFYQCTGLKSVDLSNCRKIYNMAFYGCTGLESASLGSVEEMYEGAFFGSGLKTVELPESLTYYEKGVFADCQNLKEIKVDEDNEMFFNDENGVLYRRLANGTYQIDQFPAGSRLVTYAILDNTVRINDYAFAYAQNLIRIDIDKDCERVGTYAFFYCGMKTGNILYVFHSLNAPAMEAYFSNSTSITDLYNNFTYKFGYVQMQASWPQNGVGYDNFLYSKYFKVAALLPDVATDVTEDIIARIDALTAHPTTLADATEIAQVREMFDKLEDGQKALVTNYYKFVEAERALAGLQSGGNSDQNASDVQNTPVIVGSDDDRGGLALGMGLGIGLPVVMLGVGALLIFRTKRGGTGREEND